MKNFINKSLLLALCSTAVIGCKPKFDEPAPSAGSADFSKFVTIGDGTAGGYADASLNRESQIAAFPNILATQFKLVGGGEFAQPLVEEGKSYGFENNKANSKYDLHYKTFCDGKTELYPEPTYTISTGDIISFTIPTPPPYNNLAAQGAKLIYINKTPPWKSTSATYWQKISTGSSSTMLKDALAQSPTFVCINAGTVDVFRFAKSGGNQDNGDDDFITPANEFRDSLYSILKAFKAKNANVKGVITNIIDVNSFPYFTYIKYDGLILSESQAAALNTFYSGQFSFHAGRNAYVIADPAATNGKRQIKKGEFVLIETPQDSLRCYKLGSELPIRRRWVLDETEVNTINTTVANYNAILKAAADAYGYAYVDGNSNIKDVVKGTQFQGIKYTSEMIVGNQFSVDGLNISPFGQAILANNCIVEINKKYGSTIPFYDATKARGVMFH